MQIHALLNGADILSDYDDIVVKRVPTEAELQYVQSELLKSADNLSSLDANMLNELQHTDLSFNSLEIKIAHKCPLTSVFDIHPKEYDFFAPNNININNEILSKYHKSVFVPQIFRAWLLDPSTPKPQRINLTFTGNKATSHYFDRFELLQIDEDSDFIWPFTLNLN